jgi:hypothetical protein
MTTIEFFQGILGPSEREYTQDPTWLPLSANQHPWSQPLHSSTPPPLTKVEKHLYAVLPGTGKAFIATFPTNNSHLRTFYGHPILSPSHFQSHISIPFRLKTEGDCSARFSVSVFFSSLN